MALSGPCLRLFLVLLAASCSRAGAGQLQLPLEAALEAARRVEIGSPQEFVEALQLTDPYLRLTGGLPVLSCVTVALRPRAPAQAAPFGPLADNITLSEAVWGKDTEGSQVTAGRTVALESLPGRGPVAVQQVPEAAVSLQNATLLDFGGMWPVFNINDGGRLVIRGLVLQGAPSPNAPSVAGAWPRELQIALWPSLFFEGASQVCLLPACSVKAALRRAINTLEN